MQTGKGVDAGKNILELYTAQNGMLGKGGIGDFVGNESWVKEEQRELLVCEQVAGQYVCEPCPGLISAVSLNSLFYCVRGSILCVPIGQCQQVESDHGSQGPLWQGEVRECVGCND